HDRWSVVPGLPESVVVCFWLRLPVRPWSRACPRRPPDQRFRSARPLPFPLLNLFAAERQRFRADGKPFERLGSDDHGQHLARLSRGAESRLLQSEIVGLVLLRRDLDQLAGGDLIVAIARASCRKDQNRFAHAAICELFAVNYIQVA